MHTLATTAYGRSLELFPEPFAMCLFTTFSSACSNEILKKMPYISNCPITRKWVASPILGLGITWMANQFSFNRDAYLGITTAIAIIGSLYFTKDSQQPEVPFIAKIPDVSKREEDSIQPILPKGLRIDPKLLSQEIITLLSFIQPILKQINTEGLFREPGNKTEVTALIKKLNSSKKSTKPVSMIIKDKGIKTITSALKELLKKYGLLDGIKEKLLNMEEPDVQSLKKTLLELEEEKRERLRILLYCLSEIVANFQRNKMTAENLSSCIGFSLIEANKDPYKALNEVQKVNSITKFLIENYREIFSE
ncbi:MAG: hypothetical protein K1000chlam3_01706 [Chlamydiae bacterium]|nr:hypothetical protein [Chlamydiota bacterium]